MASSPLVVSRKVFQALGQIMPAICMLVLAFVEVTKDTAATLVVP